MPEHLLNVRTSFTYAPYERDPFDGKGTHLFSEGWCITVFLPGLVLTSSHLHIDIACCLSGTFEKDDEGKHWLLLCSRTAVGCRATGLCVMCARHRLLLVVVCREYVARHTCLLAYVPKYCTYASMAFHVISLCLVALFDNFLGYQRRCLMETTQRSCKSDVAQTALSSASMPARGNV